MTGHAIDYTSTGLYVTHEDGLEFDPAYWFDGPSTWRDPFRSVAVPVLRDANGRDGEWPQVIRLEHDPMWLSWDEGKLYVIPPEEVLPADLLVPLFVGDPERPSWRRRKWWGRGPVRPF